MTKKEIIYSKQFIKSYKKLPNNIKEIFSKKIEIFTNNIFNVSLNTHKLHGNLENCYSIYVNYQYRAVFEFEQDKINFLFIGKHDIYNKID